MADKKISALSAASTPVAGTEVLPIVQSSSTVKVSVANLTAGRAVSAASLSLTTTALTVANGGTGLTSFTAGDIPYYVSGTTLTALGIGAANRVMTSSGSAPQWSTSLNLSGSITSGGTLQALATVQSSSGADLSLNANGANRDVIVKVNGAEVSRFVGSTGNQTIANGNLVPSTAAKGVNFTANTPAAGMTSQLLNWYEEITAASTACTGAITTAVSWTLTRVGNVVTLTLPPVTGAATSSINFEFGVLIPSGYRPSSSLVFPCGIRDNDANQSTPGMVIITSGGNIRVYVNIAASANFTANVSATAAGFAQGCGFSCSWRL